MAARKRGRKPTDPSTHLSSRIMVGFTQDEREQIEDLASEKRPRMSTATYIHDLVLRHLRRKR